MRKITFLFFLVLLTACTSPDSKKSAPDSAALISESVIMAAIDGIKSSQTATDPLILEKGVKHAASLWRSEDGTTTDFTEFVKANYISDPAKRKVIFNKISNYVESIY